MGKKARSAAPSRAIDPRETESQDVPVVGLREPCPCGSGRRYKACHGKSASTTVASGRPFEGFASECDIIAMRELVPSATAALTLCDGRDRTVTLATVLPMAWPALVRQDGEVLLGLQVTTGTGDPSRDLGSALARALEAEPGNPVPPARDTTDAPRLQDLVDPGAVLHVHVHEGFDFWIEAGNVSDDVRASLERANSYANPTSRLPDGPGVQAAYWTRIGDKEHLRWVMPQPEEALLDALARLHAANETSLGEGTRLVGMFRTLGLVAPVWDLPVGFGAQGCEEPAAAFAVRLEEALTLSQPLTDRERRARAGLTTRQVTLR